MPLAIRDPLCPLLHQVLIRNHRSSEQRLLLHITDFTCTAEGQFGLLSVSVLLLSIFFFFWTLFFVDLIFIYSLNEWGLGEGWAGFYHM